MVAIFIQSGVACEAQCTVTLESYNCHSVYTWHFLVAKLHVASQLGALTSTECSRHGPVVMWVLHSMRQVALLLIRTQLVLTQALIGQVALSPNILVSHSEHSTHEVPTFNRCPLSTNSTMAVCLVRCREKRYCLALAAVPGRETSL